MIKKVIIKFVVVFKFYKFVAVYRDIVTEYNLYKN